jgi:hypothetical protein
MELAITTDYLADKLSPESCLRRIAIHNRIVASCDHASRTGLPRFTRLLPDMLSPLPRWIGID